MPLSEADREKIRKAIREGTIKNLMAVTDSSGHVRIVPRSEKPSSGAEKLREAEEISSFRTIGATGGITTVSKTPTSEAITTGGKGSLTSRGGMPVTTKTKTTIKEELDIEKAKEVLRNVNAAAREVENKLSTINNPNQEVVQKIKQQIIKARTAPRINQRVDAINKAIRLYNMQAAASTANQLRYIKREERREKQKLLTMARVLANEGIIPSSTVKSLEVSDLNNAVKIINEDIEKFNRGVAKAKTEQVEFITKQAKALERSNLLPKGSSDKVKTLALEGRYKSIEKFINANIARRSRLPKSVTEALTEGLDKNLLQLKRSLGNNPAANILIDMTLKQPALSGIGVINAVESFIPKEQAIKITKDIAFGGSPHLIDAILGDKQAINYYLKDPNRIVGGLVGEAIFTVLTGEALAKAASKLGVSAPKLLRLSKIKMPQRTIKLPRFTNQMQIQRYATKVVLPRLYERTPIQTIRSKGIAIKVSKHIDKAVRNKVITKQEAIDLLKKLSKKDKQIVKAMRSVAHKELKKQIERDIKGFEVEKQIRKRELKISRRLEAERVKEERGKPIKSGRQVLLQKTKQVAKTRQKAKIKVKPKSIPKTKLKVPLKSIGIIQLIPKTTVKVKKGRKTFVLLKPSSKVKINFAKVPKISLGRSLKPVQKLQFEQLFKHELTRLVKNKPLTLEQYKRTVKQAAREAIKKISRQIQKQQQKLKPKIVRVRTNVTARQVKKPAKAKVKLQEEKRKIKKRKIKKSKGAKVIRLEV